MSTLRGNHCRDYQNGNWIIGLWAGLTDSATGFESMLTARAVVDDFGSLVIVRRWWQ